MTIHTANQIVAVIGASTMGAGMACVAAQMEMARSTQSRSPVDTIRLEDLLAWAARIVAARVRQIVEKTGDPIYQPSAGFSSFGGRA